MYINETCTSHYVLLPNATSHPTQAYQLYSADNGYKKKYIRLHICILWGPARLLGWCAMSLGGYLFWTTALLTCWLYYGGTVHPDLNIIAVDHDVTLRLPSAPMLYRYLTNPHITLWCNLKVSIVKLIISYHPAWSTQPFPVKTLMWIHMTYMRKFWK